MVMREDYCAFPSQAEGLVRLQIKGYSNYSVFVHNPRPAGHPVLVDPHLVNAVLEEIVKQSGTEGARVSNGQIMLFGKDGHQGKCSGAPLVGIPNARDVEKALVVAGYQLSGKKH